MAAAAPSSLFCNRIFNISFPHSSISLTCKFPQTPLKFKSQLFISSQISLHHLLLPSASFDGFEVAHDTQQEDPQPKTSEISSSEDEDEQKKFSNSNQTGTQRLYVGNLPYSLTSTQLAELFGEAGNVVSVEIVYDRITDRSRGFAFLTMGSVEDAEEAIRLFDGSQVGGRSIKVNIPEVPKRLVLGSKVSNKYKGFADSPHKIYAGNLGWGVTSQSLRDAFAEQPGFLSAKVIYERNSGRSRGYGFVSFETAEDLEAALNSMNGVEVLGRPLRLNLAAVKTPPSLPVIAQNTGSNVDSWELLSSVST